MRRQQASPAQDRGARIIQLAIRIMAQGARGWSDAMAQARKQVK